MRLTPIFGRSADIRAIDTMLDTTRLVTVVGPGGIGKSTVALAAAGLRCSRTAVGARFVDLAHCRYDGDVVPYFAGTLNLPCARETGSAEIAAALARKSLVLVLDNCEMVIDAVAELADRIAGAAPGVRVIATSREPLRVPGERIVRLPGLAIPQAVGPDAAPARTAPALALLADRACAVDAGFRLSDDDLPGAIRLCRQLDGIPLAIELAAARLDTIGIDEMVERLDADHGLLSGGLRTAMPRHKTLEATLDWSFAILSELERTVLQSLSVFRATFSLEAALSVATTEGEPTAPIARCVGDLVTKSMIVVQAQRDGRRYRMLETTRQYAGRRLEKQGDRDAVRRRHAQTCLNLLGGARDELLRLRRDLWMDRYGTLVADVQSAIEWAFSPAGDRYLGSWLVIGAAPLGEQLVLSRDYFGRLEEVVEAGSGTAGDAGPEISKLGLPLAHVHIQLQGDLRLGQATVKRMAEGQDRSPEVVAAEFGAALLSGQYPDALRLAGEIVEIGRRMDDASVQMLASRCAAQAHFYLGNIDDAAQQAQRVLDSPFEYLPHSMNNHRITMRVVLGSCSALRADFRQAFDFLEEAIRLGRRDNPLTLSVAMTLGAIPAAIWAGDEARARDWLDEARKVAEQSGAAFWSLSVEQLARGVAAIRGEVVERPEDAHLEDKIGHSVLDMLPTFSRQLFSQRAEDRVRKGLVAWNAAEVQRVAVVRRRPRSCADARARLIDAAEVARRQGSLLWLDRIERTLIELASAPGTDLTL
ncbi:ATP-binding protein [Amaricoccus sp.]|uniref:ATP-binding protein n=1 Tax=Amaricoccus sp. TaxID=1872485 RepID=UPI002D1FBCAF|nr:hypothetical protein [Amaricoccus sp.]